MPKSFKNFIQKMQTYTGQIEGDQTGIIHIVGLFVALAAVGIVAFLLIASSAPFKNQFLSALFPKPASHASGPGITFLDTNNQVITSTISPNIKLELNAPWPIADAGFQLIKTADAQGSGATITAKVSSSSDDVNEVSGKLDPVYGANFKSLWVGNGGVANGTSYTAMRFTNVNIPRGAQISSAKVQLVSSQNQWLTVGFTMAAENSGNSQTFSSSSLPSKRSLTTNKTDYSADANWSANSTQSLPDIAKAIQEVVNRSDWNSGNSISVILKGTGGGAYSRKFVFSFDGSASNAPKLVVTYGGGSNNPTPTPVVTPKPTVKPSSTPIPTAPPPPTPTAAPTPKVIVANATVAEDSNFTQNVKNVGGFTSSPQVVDYTLSGGTGVKTVYVKFVSSTGLIQVFQNTIQVNSPATPTPTISGGGPGSNSAAMGIWSPNATYDTCPSYPSTVVTAQDKTNYIKGIHDSYKVQGPDGKWYPTWHPAVDPATGCKFGHEHGRDPKGSLVWNQVQKYFAYDANHDGNIDSAEIAAAGIPFAYANEQLDSYNGGVMMRHEDHVGHKVEYANGESDTVEKYFGNDTNLGVVVPVKGGSKWVSSGARCYYFSKVHQGVNSPDATMNNLHEVFQLVDCKGPTAAYDMTAAVDVMGEFGKVGEFTNLCVGDNDRITPVITGTNATNQNYPGVRGDTDREIIQRSCIEKWFLVPAGGSLFSSNFYESWRAAPIFKTASGKQIMQEIGGMFFDVEDSSRYYWPGHTDANTGQLNVGRAMDLCYENFNGRVIRHIDCDSATNYGAIKGIKWDDPRSAFRGTHRGMYFQPPVVTNAGGPSVWYTDPFGGNAQTTPFTGSIMQLISAKNVNFDNLGSTDPRVNDRDHNDGGGTVHAPN